MTARKIDIKDIIATYPKEKMLLERWNKVWLYYAGRLPSFYLTWIFLRLNMSANQATSISVIVGLASCAFLALGSYGTKLAGAIMATLFLTLDCVDGNIARYRKSFSPFGEYVDALAGYVVTAFLYMSLGVGVFTNPNSSLLLTHPEGFFIAFNKEVFLIVGFWSSLSYVLARLISLRYKTIVTSAPNNDTSRDVPPKRIFRIISILSRNIFDPGGLFMPLLLFAAIFKFLGLLTLCYGAVNSCALIVTIAKNTWKFFRAIK